MTRSGFKCLFVLVIVASALLAFWALVLEPNIPDLEWDNSVLTGIRELRENRPPDVPQGQWNFMVDWTLNLHANCGAYQWANRKQRWQFLEEFERRLHGPVDPATIDWIWDEYVRHAKNGKSYSDRYRPTRSPDLKRA